MIEIDYEVKESGWANGKIGNGQEFHVFSISYLHDSLKELAQTATNINTKDYHSVIFMDEPGEHKLIINRISDTLIEFELRWYKDWASWNVISESDFQKVLNGQTTCAKYVNAVRNVLINIFDSIGPTDYKNKWIKHDFPMKEYLNLK